MHLLVGYVRHDVSTAHFVSVQEHTSSYEKAP